MTEVNCCDPRHPLNHDGTSQAQRASAMLDPAKVLLDDRSLAHLLAWASRYGRELVFYNAQNKISGDWESLMSADPSTLIAVISLFDHKAFLADFSHLEARVGELNAVSARRGAFRDMCQHLIKLATLFDNWYQHAPTDLLIARELDTAIRADLAPALQRLKAYDFGAEMGLAGANAAPLDLDFGALMDRSVWGLAGVAPSDRIYEGASPAAKITHATVRIAALFGRMHRVLVRTVGAAPRLLADSIDWPYHQPHMALFIAFLKLFGLVQGSLNDLPRRHLVHYYQDVLRLGRKSAVPDQAHLVFTPAVKQKDAFLLPAGAEFKAGKDSSGQELRYRLDTAAALNAAVVADTRALYLEDTGGETRLYLSPVAASADGKGGAFEKVDETQWKSFGHDTARDQAALGLIVSTPTLLLAEGDRIIRLTLSFASAHGIAAADANHLFAASISSEKGWFDISDIEVDAISNTQGLTLKLTLTPDAPAVTAFKPGLELGPDGSTVPLLRLLATGEKVPNYYGFLTGTAITGVTLEVDVKGMRSLVLANDIGPIPADKPFMPFGPQPKDGAAFYIGSWEAFQKKLTQFSLEIEWDTVPDFSLHYAGYNRDLNGDNNNDDPVFTTPANADITGKVELLDQGRKSLGARIPWLRITSPWVEVQPADDTLFPLNASRGCTLEVTMPGYWRRKTDLEPFSAFNAGGARGFARITLEGDLLHSAYTTAYTLAAIGLAKGQNATLPNAPYVPVAKSITMNYLAQDQWNLAALGTVDASECLFHIYPYGYKKLTGGPVTLLPDLDLAEAPYVVTVAGPVRRAGHLYVGFANAPDSEFSYALSVLFQVAEGTEDPRLDPPIVRWAYLAGGSWTNLETGTTVEDGTRGFTQSGIVRFTIGPDASLEHTVLPTGLLWLRATVLTDPNGLSDLVAIHAQAATVTFKDSDNAADHLAAALPAGTIAKMVDKDVRLAGVAQPFGSFGGQMKEADSSFYVRVSERLRHKERAIAIWDYERLVLDHFPEIYKVKCLSHATNERELAPGHVAVIVIPNVRNKNGFDRLEPYASQALRARISDMLAGRLPLSAKAGLSVLPPVYERLSTSFKVDFQDSVTDATLATEQLKRDIVRFLCPWAFDGGRDISIGGRIPASAIIDFIDELDYVDSVHDFVLTQSHNGQNAPVNEAVAHTARSVLVAAPEADHVITERGAGA